KLRILRTEIVLVNYACQMLRNLRATADECIVDDHLCALIGKITAFEEIDLATYRFEVPLHVINSHGQARFQLHFFCVLAHYRRVVSEQCQVVTDEDSPADGESERK